MFINMHHDPIPVGSARGGDRAKRPQTDLFERVSPRDIFTPGMEEGVACFVKRFINDGAAFGGEISVDFVAGVIIKERMHRVLRLRVLLSLFGFHVRCRRFRAFPIRRQRPRQLCHRGVLREFGGLRVILLRHKPGYDSHLIDRQLTISKHRKRDRQFRGS